VKYVQENAPWGDNKPYVWQERFQNMLVAVSGDSIVSSPGTREDIPSNESEPYNATPMATETTLRKKEMRRRILIWTTSRNLVGGKRVCLRK
jgi:hypothetical protein